MGLETGQPKKNVLRPSLDTGFGGSESHPMHPKLQVPSEIHLLGRLHIPVSPKLCIIQNPHAVGEQVYVYIPRNSKQDH